MKRGLDNVTAYYYSQVVRDGHGERGRGGRDDSQQVLIDIGTLCVVYTSACLSPSKRL